MRPEVIVWPERRPVRTVSSPDPPDTTPPAQTEKTKGCSCLQYLCFRCGQCHTGHLPAFRTAPLPTLPARVRTGARGDRAGCSDHARRRQSWVLNRARTSDVVELSRNTPHAGLRVPRHARLRALGRPLPVERVTSGRPVAHVAAEKGERPCGCIHPGRVAKVPSARRADDATFATRPSRSVRGVRVREAGARRGRRRSRRTPPRGRRGRGRSIRCRAIGRADRRSGSRGDGPRSWPAW